MKLSDNGANTGHTGVGTLTAAASRPFWADLIHSGGPAPASTPTRPVTLSTAALATAQTVSSTTVSPATGSPVQSCTGGVDLVVTSVAPQRFDNGADGGYGDRSADLVALHAARLLRTGGTLVVLTHCDWSSGELTDPTGVIVAAGQNADLLYLQHVVAVHAPLHNGRFDPRSDLRSDADTDVDPGVDSGRSVDISTISTSTVGDADDDTSAGPAQERDRACGWPEPHRRVHSDLLVFAQPADHEPTAATGTDVLAHSGGAAIADHR